MSLERALERFDPDWRLYVTDFPGDQWQPQGWVSTRLHVQPTARVKVEQQTSPQQGPLVWVAFGPHCQLFLPRAVAARLRERLCAVLDDQIVDIFSTGVSVDGLSSPAVSATPVAAPVEPTKKG